MIGWRAMRAEDLPRVNALADVIHTAIPEDETIFPNKFALYPEGCHVYVLNDVVMGYMIGHPWHDGSAPALNTLISALPKPAPIYFIHDIALHADTRGSGAGMSFFREQSLALSKLFEAVRCVTINEGVYKTCRAIGYTELFRPYPGYGPDSAFLELRVG